MARTAARRSGLREAIRGVNLGLLRFAAFVMVREVAAARATGLSVSRVHSQSMIGKSVQRFFERIILDQKSKERRRFNQTHRALGPERPRYSEADIVVPRVDIGFGANGRAE